jgi:hypothetical protein
MNREKTMVDPEIRYTAAAVALRKAEREYAEAESRLIEARREVGAARIGTAYSRAIAHHADRLRA